LFVVSNELSFVNFTWKKAKFAGRYRITDSDSLDAAMEAAGRIRLTVEAKLMLNLRRHGVNGRWHGISDTVASGNFLGAKVSTIMLVLYCISSFIYI
jgi:acetylglutamate kinase